MSFCSFRYGPLDRTSLVITGVGFMLIVDFPDKHGRRSVATKVLTLLLTRILEI